jgi:hypothetical protein
MNASSIARVFAVLIAVGFTILLVAGLMGRGENSLRSVAQKAQADSMQHLLALSRAGLPQ